MRAPSKPKKLPRPHRIQQISQPTRRSSRLASPDFVDELPSSAASAMSRPSTPSLSNAETDNADADDPMLSMSGGDAPANNNP